MTRGDGYMTKVHFRGQHDDFIVYAESSSAVQKWKGDKSTPLVDVVDSFQIFVSHKCVSPPYCRSPLPSLQSQSADDDSRLLGKAHKAISTKHQMRLSTTSSARMMRRK